VNDLNPFKIMAYAYTVEFQQNIALNSDDVARHYSMEGRIVLDKLLEKNRPENDLMHEVFESLKWQMELESLDHDVLTALANGVCAVLRDNPEFTKLFLK